MNIVMCIDDVSTRNIFIGNNIRNNIINNGSFYKIKYSNSEIILNNLMILLNISDCSFVENYNRYRCIFKNKNKDNVDIVDKISSLEKKILSKFECNKYPHYNIRSTLQSGVFNIGYYPRNDETMCLKISGIWENEDEYGLTYKFVIMSKNHIELPVSCI